MVLPSTFIDRHWMNVGTRLPMRLADKPVKTMSVLAALVRMLDSCPRGSRNLSRYFRRRAGALYGKRGHRQYHPMSKPGTVTVAGKDSVEMPPGTLNGILKQTGLTK